MRELPSPLADDSRQVPKLAVEDLEHSSDWLRVVAASTTLGIFVYGIKLQFPVWPAFL